MSTRTDPDLDALLREYVGGDHSLLGVIADWLADRRDPRERAVREVMADPLSFRSAIAGPLARARWQSMGSYCPIPEQVVFAQALDEVGHFLRLEREPEHGRREPPPGLRSEEFRKLLCGARAAWVKSLFGGD